ncbi:MAG: Asp-tRNA(Asn)/Glu-tRNA(Gln) amidotransferase subunit GatC [Candidatus Aerophobetes bacterium]|nr:Asp-tRNA(Asn)/Glu-tRNA(Gln) amidotransferase subunit GatC [Candidatus Aerophobetes bacterium]
MKKGIDKEQTRYIAHLARLKLSEEEEEKFTKQLSDILAYVDKLKEVNTKNTPPTSHVLFFNNVFREDEKKSSLPLKEVLSIAPQQKRGYFQVPKIIG